MRYKPDSANLQSVNQELLDREEILDTSRMHLIKAQCRMEERADMGSKEVTFEAGD